MSKSNSSLIVLLGKLSPKIFPILAKMHDALWPMLKSLFGIKSVGLVGSIGLYTYLFTWQMAVALVVFIGIHEYGHLWAMKRCGIKTRGMFFLPGFGAVAVAEERFKSARNEAYIAIMGPIFGLAFFVFPMMIVYHYTRDAMWAAIGAIMAFINLVNLFPINPLDGGRILKALAYSQRRSASLWITVTVLIITAVFGTLAGFSLLSYMAIVGLWEIASEFGIKERIRSFLMTLARGAVAVGMFFVAQYFFKEFGKYWAEESESQSVIWLSLIGTIMLGGLLAAVFDIKASTVDKGRSVLMYPIAVLGELWKGIRQVLGLRSQDIQPIENYERMGGGGKTWYAFNFLFLTKEFILDEKDKRFVDDFKGDLLKNEVDLKQVQAELDFCIKKMFSNFFVDKKNIVSATLSEPFVGLKDPKVSLGAGRGT